jgi:hypothetical protein
MKRDVIFFNELGSMDDMLSLEGRPRFTGDLGGATTTLLRQILRCSRSRPQVKAATVGLTDNDRFH